MSMERFSILNSIHPAGGDVWMRPHETPCYGIGEAARYLGIAPSTLRSWVRGRTYGTQAGRRFAPPVIELPEEGGGLLSFVNLVEAHILWALRNRQSVPLQKVRQAMEYAQRELGVERLLLHRDLRTTSGEIFLEKYNQLLNLSRSGQYAMKELLDRHLSRLEWDSQDRPLRLYPFLAREAMSRAERNGSRGPIVIDPTVQFGRPVLWRVGVSTEIIVERIDAGEPPEVVAEDYDIDMAELRDILLFERAA